MQQKKLTHLFKNYFLVIALGIFSFFINYHYGFIGIMPMDNTVLFNGGYRIINGFIPFTDYWLVTGPLLDYLNAFFFKIFGLSWKSFIIHSSIINLLIAISSYFLFIILNLDKKFALFYSLLISILFYPVVGTPFVDHHSTFFLVLAYYSLILAIKKDLFYYYLIIPTLLCLSFLSKQTPAAYGLVTIITLILLQCFFEKDKIKKIILYSIYGTIISFTVLFSFLIFTNINLSNFYSQYFLFASSIGKFRLSMYEFKFFNEILNFKFLYFYIFILAGILFNLIKNNKINRKDVLVILISIFFSLSLIFHQMLTLNQNYIFFLIPFLCAVIHIYCKIFFDKRYILIISLVVCIYSVTKYHIRFNEYRKFNELEKVDISKAIDAEQLSGKLKGLKWITYKFPDNPQKELDYLKQIVDIMKREKSKTTLITEYQILAPISGKYDHSPNQWHHPTVSFPLKNQKYYDVYKSFFIKSLKKNEIRTILETSKQNETVTEEILDKSCLKKERLNEILVKFELKKDCGDLE